MLLAPTATLLLATLASTVASSTSPAFRITLTNTNLTKTATHYTALGDGTPLIVNSTAVFDRAELDCLYEFYIPEFHCLLQDKNLTRSVDLGPGTTQMSGPMSVGRITCGWSLPESW